MKYLFEKGEKNKSWKGGQVFKKCIECGKEYKVYPYRKDNSSYCSKYCSNHSKVKAAKTYSHANVGFKKGQFAGNKHYRFGKHISEEVKKKISQKLIGRKTPLEVRKKMGLQTKGPLNWNWKGGATSLAEKIRKCFNYRLWRSDIYTRDDFTCQICGIRGGKLHVDHYPESFSSIRYRLKINSLEQALGCEELWNLNNGRTLCVPCHKKTDTYLKNIRKEPLVG